VNGDGLGDLIIGAESVGSDGKRHAGETYVIFGSDAGFDADFPVTDLDGSNGFRLSGVDAGDFSGKSDLQGLCRPAAQSKQASVSLTSSFAIIHERQLCACMTSAG